LESAQKSLRHGKERKMDRFVIELSFSKIEIEVTDVGKDKLVLVMGGEKPHIGCTVVAIPRPSLTENGSISVTSSVINVTGHKDEAICRIIAERFATRFSCIVTCTGGFHMDNITQSQLDEIQKKINCFNV